MDISPDVLAYVHHAARFLELPLTAAQAERVATHLARTKQMVAALKEVPLSPADELVQIFCPAPFPPEDPA